MTRAVAAAGKIWICGNHLNVVGAKGKGKGQRGYKCRHHGVLYEMDGVPETQVFFTSWQQSETAD